MLVVALTAAGCFSPSALAPCALSCVGPEDCPSGLACEGGRCGACGDGAAPDADRDLDAGLDLDAPVDPRDASEVECAALVPPDGCVVRECGRCFAVCFDHVSRAEAVALCGAWGGALAQPRIELQRECLAMAVTSLGWVDLNQATGATAVASGWAWAGGTPFDGTWSPGEPDDGDVSGLEAGREQCASIAAGSGELIDLSCPAGNAQAICVH